VRVPADLPAPYAALTIALIVVAVSYLMLVDWIHPPNPPEK
jgi:hypothetical protein